MIDPKSAARRINPILRVSRIERRWLRRIVIVASYPIMTVLGWFLIIFKLVLHVLAAVLSAVLSVVSAQCTLLSSSISVWQLPSGDVQDLIDPVCAGGIHELEREQYDVCPKCGTPPAGPCKFDYLASPRIAT